MPEIGALSSGILVVVSLAGIVFVMVSGRASRVEQRLSDLSGGRPEAAGGVGVFDPRPGTADVTAVRPGARPIDRALTRRLQQEEKKKDLKQRLVQAGVYRPAALRMFVVVRVLLFAGPVAGGLVLAKMGGYAPAKGLLLGLAVGAGGTIAPSFWLDIQKRSRQTKIRRALPDALDVMVICLQGGLSLTAAITRVASELATAHPMLAVELKILERQVQLGRTVGEGMRELAKRFDLEELRSMASVIVQAERVGSSIASALEVFAQTLRERRYQRAEEMAQKAVIKMIFPMPFCIFPALLIVLIGPAAIIIYERLIKAILSSGAADSPFL
ncbi:MAG: type II secretion system F family protein [Planctomycetota bacterium]|jgi:tight adherence protein C